MIMRALLRNFAIAILLSLPITGLVSYHCAKDKQDMAKCERFVDEHWIPSRYAQWVQDCVVERTITIIDSNGVINYDSLLVAETQGGFYHHLPSSKNSEYYVLVSKYDQFCIGWDDAGAIDCDDTTSCEITPNRMWYLDCREKAAKGKIIANTP